MTLQLDTRQRAMLEAMHIRVWLLEAPPAANAIISGAGLPLRLPELVKDHDVLIAPIVSSGKACKVIIKHWLKKYQRTPDFIVTLFLIITSFSIST